MRDVRQRETARTLLFFILMFSVLLLLNLLTPAKIADDYNYCFSWATGERIRSIGDIYYSLITHRRGTNGRVFSHFFAQLFLMLPPWVFKTVNAAVLTAGVWLMGRYVAPESREDGRGRLTALRCGVLLLWLCMPAFGQVFLWLDGACNYAWGLVLALWFLLPFYQDFRKEDHEHTPLNRLLYLPLGFLAGAYSEHIAFSMLAVCFLLTLLIWRQNRRFPLIHGALLAAGCTGYLYLMLAPSMLAGNRGEVSGAALQQFEQGLIQMVERQYGPIWGRLPLLAAALAAGVLLVLVLTRPLARKFRFRRRWVALALLVVLGYAAVLALTIRSAVRNGGGFVGAVNLLLSSSALGIATAFSWFALLFIAALNRRVAREKLVFSGILFLGGCASLALFAFAAYFPARGCAVSVLFAILAGACLLKPVSETHPRGRRVVARVVTVAFVFSFAFGMVDLLRVHRIDRARETAIAAALQNGETGAPMEPYNPQTKYSAAYGLVDINPELEWPCDVIARYYGLQILYKEP